MNELTNEQKEFLKHHNISLDKVYNANGKSPNEYRVQMKNLGKQFAYNVAPCQNSGHTLRDRSGHCIQCNPASIAFMKRNDSAGFLYIAATIKGKVLKIGFTKELSNRDASLNRTKYAGFNDWIILFAIESQVAGQVENQIKNIMEPYKEEFDYNHDGNHHDSGETYTCSYSKIKKSLLDLCESRNHLFSIKKNIKSNLYEFKNLSRIN